MLHALLCLAPALALALLLLARRYPGERALLAIRGRRERPRLPRAARVLSSHTRDVAIVVRGGRLIGSSLAVRPPPALRAAS